MTTTRPDRSAAVLATLALGTFVAGSAELLPVGLLPHVASSFGVTQATAGTLVGGYALGLAVGGPILTAVTLRLDRRTVLLCSLTAFVVLVAEGSVAPHFGWFVATRAGAGASQGLFLGAAFTTATAVVPPERAGRALAVVIAGFAVATVAGLPLGVVVGDLLGWRGAVLSAAGLAVAVVLLAHVVVPSIPSGGALDTSELRDALSGKVLAMFGLTVVLFAAPASVLTYLVPVLHEVVGLARPVATVALVAYGAACVAGSLVGGRWADTDAARALVVSTGGLLASFVLLYAGRSQPVVAVLAVLAWAVTSSSAPPSVQHRTLSLAGTGGALAASLPASAASAGIALGSAASGAAYSAWGPAAVVLTGICLALGALVLAGVTRRIRPTTAEAGSAPVAEHVLVA